MATRKIVYRRPPEGATDVGAQLTRRFQAIRHDLNIPIDFPAAALAEATAGVSAADLPGRDETQLPFITIDPAESTDLDQAMHLQREGEGYRVRYAIADVPAFVHAGGALDEETRRRGQTVYCPDVRVQLHPSELSENAASLLPGQVRPAFVWDIVLAADGECVEVSVYRAMVRSVRRYDYETVQRAVSDGSAEECLMLLKEVGEKRAVLELKRGGASLPLPEQTVSDDGSGGFSIAFRPMVPAEDWNAQISLLTGMGAAELMLTGRVGILRTMPPPDPSAIRRFHHQARAAGVEWPEGMSYGELLRTLDRDNPRQLALIHEATTLFRGAGYTPFDGSIPEQPQHAAVANPYAHVTAPLRRLVDRFGLVLCESLSAGVEVPAWVREALPLLPAIMEQTDRRADAVTRACTDSVEAAELLGHVGSQVDGFVVDEHEKGCVVQLTDFAVVAAARGSAPPGTAVSVRVDSAEIETGRIELTVL